MLATDLAELIGCDALLIERVETNIMPIPGIFLVAWANALHTQPERLILEYINQQARCMCLDAGLTPLFKVVPLEEEDAPTFTREDSRKHSHMVAPAADQFA
jgi:hypothetical protein